VTTLNDTPGMVAVLYPAGRSRRKKAHQVPRPLATMTPARRAKLRQLDADLQRDAAALNLQLRLDALDDAAGVPLRKYERRLNALKRGQ